MNWKHWLACMALLFLGGAAQAQVNLSGWTFRVAGQVVQVTDEGSVVIPNIQAPDQFGPGGPGTRPDFLSDDPIRVVGKSNDEGVPLYAFSEFFQLRQGETYTIKNWTFTSIPPPQPVSLKATIDKPALTELGETAQVTVLGELADGTFVSLTTAESWTVYRVSNPNVISIDANGKVTAVSAGTAFVTAVNEGTTAVLQIDIVPGGELTTIQGVVLDTSDNPVAGVTAYIIGAAGTGNTDALGNFVIQGVAAERRISGIIVRGVTANGQVFGKTGSLEVVPGGITDAGIIRVQTCAELGIDCTDTDNDCIPDAIERAIQTNPQSPDSDNDGIPDGEEDTDGDTLTNCTEVLYGLNPGNVDSDGDGLGDFLEIFRFGTDPTNRDTDRDGMSDGAEFFAGTDYFNWDTDGDGLDDWTETLSRMDPLVPDSGLIASISSPPVGFLNARGAAIPKDVLVSVASAPASYFKPEFRPRPSSVLVTVSSPSASYLNALPGQASPRQFVASSIASYKNNAGAGGGGTPAAGAAGGALDSVSAPVRETESVLSEKR